MELTNDCDAMSVEHMTISESSTHTAKTGNGGEGFHRCSHIHNDNYNKSEQQGSSNNSKSTGEKRSATTTAEPISTMTKKKNHSSHNALNYSRNFIQYPQQPATRLLENDLQKNRENLEFMRLIHLRNESLSDFLTVLCKCRVFVLAFFLEKYVELIVQNVCCNTEKFVFEL
ncbi:Hypothetical predicted protein [Octopus vulgaris]|uniref:Uncharacterized protein n=1 Tax=Octopus vulgaris TaxID=6645 RepID=A0AA36AVA5_OCTVU|nr:Hypothetical predicted protein [Octopus vulgaris]